MSDKDFQVKLACWQIFYAGIITIGAISFTSGAGAQLLLLGELDDATNNELHFLDPDAISFVVKFCIPLGFVLVLFAMVAIWFHLPRLAK